jgi:hypothetical protein
VRGGRGDGRRAGRERGEGGAEISRLLAERTEKRVWGSWNVSGRVDPRLTAFGHDSTSPGWHPLRAHRPQAISHHSSSLAPSTDLSSIIPVADTARSCMGVLLVSSALLPHAHLHDTANELHL